MRDTREQLERENARFNELYDQTALAYVVIGSNGVVSDLNRAAVRLLGGDRAAIAGRPFLSLVSRPDRGNFRDHLRRCGAGEMRVLTVLGVQTPAGRVPVQLVSYRSERGAG